MILRPSSAGQVHSGPTSLVAAKHRRKLGPAHFQFMRAVVQGLDPADSWRRFMRIEGETADLRLLDSTVRWIRDEFAAAARRENHFGLARLVLIDMNRVADPAKSMPTLETFVLDKGLEDFSEREQIEAYESEFGQASKRMQRRSRLMDRQLEALRWLEVLVAQPPRSGDAVASWLNPALSGLVEAAGITTLAQLIERINGTGQAWHRGIRALGSRKASRIVEWLHDHQKTIGLSVGAHAAVKRRDVPVADLRAVVVPATDIRPLEKFVVPPELDGSAGAFRRPQVHCLLAAKNDYEAVLAWLRSKRSDVRGPKVGEGGQSHPPEAHEAPGLEGLGTLSHTQRAYRKEAERFLLWAIVHKGKALSSMTHEDCTEYRAFLADPQPAARWCGKRNRERWSPLWRPFEGPLESRSQEHAVKVLRSLYGFLVDKNYLMENPWRSVSAPRSGTSEARAGRSFTVAQWAFIEEQLQALPYTSGSRRLRFALHLLYATGLRLSEATAARAGDLRRVECPANDDAPEALTCWTLAVVGKAKRVRDVPVPFEVVAELRDYLASRGLDRDPGSARNGGSFLLGLATDFDARAPGLARRRGAADPGAGIADNTLYEQVKGFFRDCAAVLEARGDEQGAEQFRNASTHWLRHTSAGHAIARGMKVEIAQQSLGHASLAAPTMYVTT